MSLSPLLFGFLVSVGLNLLVFLVAFKYQTDKLTDVTYGFTFALLAVGMLLLYGDPSQPYRLLMGLMPLLWAIRLASYLLIRVLSKGKDDRFDEIRPVWWKFGGFWLIQGVSVWVIALPFIVALSVPLAEATSALRSNFLFAGGAVFLVGWLVETIADAQKFRFKNNPTNAGKFMDKGLFSIVRFPNYTGEILVWIGIFVAAIPVLDGWQWAAVISPIWITSLLLFFSGIPTLEKAHEEKYGHLPAFQAYRQTTPKLFPGGPSDKTKG